MLPASLVPLSAGVENLRLSSMAGLPRWDSEYRDEFGGFHSVSATSIVLDRPPRRAT